MIQSSLLDHHEVRERFFQEARAAARLQHPNVASVHRLESEGENAFYVMEYVDGETLEALVRRRGRLPIKLSLDIAAQVARALSAADRHGMVHRDIKPSNIMLVSGEENDLLVKVIDFGLAKLRATPLDMTRGHFIGTPQFASPEQFAGKDVDIRADIFALGMTLWYMLTGKAPVPSGPENIEDRRGPDFALPWEQLPKLPRCVRRLLAKLLAGDPASRLQTPMLALLAIEDCRNALPGGAKKSRWVWAALAVSVIATCALAYFQFLHRLPIPADASVVIMPFENLSGKTEDAWFANSLTDEITARLSRIPNLKVAPPSSAQRLAKSNKNLAEIARALGVSTVLEGSAIQTGSNFQISTRLIDAATDKILTAASYRQEMEQIFEVEQLIALDISKIFRKRLDSKQLDRVERSPTDNIMAYNYYLHGLDDLFRFERDANERALASFKKAVEIDPGFALAYARLSAAYLQRTLSFGWGRGELDNARAAALKALDIDAGSSWAYEALGNCYVADGQYQKGFEALRTAVNLNSNQSGSMATIALILTMTGRLDEAFVWCQRSIYIDPQSSAFRTNLGDLYVAFWEYSKAAAAYKMADDLQPDQTDARIGLVRTYLLQGKVDLAKSEMSILLSTNPTVTWVQNMAAQVALFTGDMATAHSLYTALATSNRSGDLFFPYGGVRYLSALAAIEKQAGHTEAVSSLLEEVEHFDFEDIRQGPENPMPIYDLAAVEAIRGNKDAAFRLLQKAMELGWTDYVSLLMDLRFEELRTDRRWVELTSALELKIRELKRKAIPEDTLSN